MKPQPRKGSELSVFKGRGARLNRAIFLNLALQGPQNKYGLHRNLIKLRRLRKKHYGNVSKRVKALAQSGFLKKAERQAIEAGSEAAVYELSPKAYLALLLDSLSMEELLNRIGDDYIMEIIAAILASEPANPLKLGRKKP